MEKSRGRKVNYRQNGSPHTQRAASFRQQMADFARGERLRDLREGRHLSQEEAAHEIGVSTKTVRSWEKGGGIRWANAKSAGAFYGVEPESLVTLDEDRERSPDLMAELSTNGDQPTLSLILSKLNRIERMVEANARFVGNLEALAEAEGAVQDSADTPRRAKSQPDAKRQAASDS